MQNYWERNFYDFNGQRKIPEAGIYGYVTESAFGDRAAPNLNPFSANQSNGMRLLHQNGRFDYSYTNSLYTDPVSGWKDELELKKLKTILRVSTL